MQTFTNNATQAWLNQLGILTNGPRSLRFAEGKPSIVNLSAEQSNNSSPYLAANLVGISDTGKGWLLWLSDFSIWSTEVEEIGWMVIETVLQSKLELDSSAFLFDQKENLSLKAVLMISLLFNWDAFLVNADGKTFIVIDHDHEIKICTLDEKLASEIQSSQLQAWITH